MRPSFSIGFCLSAFVVFSARMSTQAATPENLLKWVPADANSVAVIHVDAMFHAPLAIRENWKKQATDRFVNHEIIVPPDAKRVVMASQLDLGGGLQPVWELGILELDRTPSFAMIARREGGQLDTIAGQPALKLHNGRTAIEVGSGIVLATAQPNRQVISRWVSSGKEAKPRLSSFLRKAIEDANSKSQLTAAMDLTDCVTAPPVRELLAKFEPLRGKTADQADIADIVASVEGVVLSVQVTDKREGSIEFQFGKSTTLMNAVALPLFEEMLSHLNIGLSDLGRWTASASGTSFVVKGEFSEEDLRKVVSLFAASSVTRDVDESEAASTGSPGAPDPATATIEASRKYFRSVKGLIEELRKTLDKSRDNQVVWMERYARKIDDLPMKNVDKDLLTFGANVSSSFRYQAQAGRMGAVRTGVREAQPVYRSYSYGAGAVGPYGTYGGYSYSGTVKVEPERFQIRTEERAGFSQVRISEMKQIEGGMVQIRRALTERYNTEF